MNPFLLMIFSIFSLSILHAQEVSQSKQSEGLFNLSNGKNYPSTSWNRPVGFSKIDIYSSNTGMSALNNFICDALLERTETDFAFINYGDIATGIYQGEITELDLVSLYPYKRTLVVLEVDGAFLKELLELNISGFRTGLAISGGKVEYDIRRPSKNRLTFFQVGDHPVYPKKEYRIVTTDYLVDGNAVFEFLTTIDSTSVFRTDILLRDAVQDYITLHSPLGSNNVRLDKRWIKK